MAIIGKQAQGRIDFLRYLDTLIQNSETQEREIHTALVNNLWVLGREYAFIASNETLKTTLEKYTNSKYSGARERKRPDLFLGQDLSNRHLLIEFKRPSKSITRDDEAQAQKYRDDLSRSFEGIEVLLLGQKRTSGTLPGHDAPGLRVLSYASLISSARRELEWLLKELRQL